MERPDCSRHPRPPDNWPQTDPRYGGCVIRSSQGRPPAGWAARLLMLTVLIAACTAQTPQGTGQTPQGSGQTSQGTPALTPDMSTACSPTAGTGPTTYPGWPPDADPELVPIIVSTELAVGPNR